VDVPSRAVAKPQPPPRHCSRPQPCQCVFRPPCRPDRAAHEGHPV